MNQNKIWNKPITAFFGLVLFLTNIATTTSAQNTQVNTGAQGVAAPASNLTFSPSIWTGARTNLVGTFSTSKNDENTFGAFVKPGITLKYNPSPISLTAKYTFETSVAKGFGDGNTFKSVANNTYYQHEPIVLLSVKANDSWKTNLFGDLWINTEHERSQNTFYEFTAQPDVEYQVSSNLSVAVGYQFFQKNYFDSSFGVDRSALAATSKGKAASAVTPKVGKFNAASLDLIGESPRTTLHAGIVTTNLKLGDKTNLVSYFRGGRQSSTIAGAKGANYRFNADLSTPITQKLSTQIRYRFHLEDSDSTNARFYNRGRVVLSYAFTKNWSADLQNTFSIEQSTADTSRAKYINENYTGATYKF